MVSLRRITVLHKGQGYEKVSLDRMIIVTLSSHASLRSLTCFTPALLSVLHAIKKRFSSHGVGLPSVTFTSRKA